MNQSQGFITMGNRIEDDSKSNDIINFFKRKILGNHLVENTVIIFIAP